MSILTKANSTVAPTPGESTALRDMTMKRLSSMEAATVMDALRTSPPTSLGAIYVVFTRDYQSRCVRRAEDRWIVGGIVTPVCDRLTLECRSDDGLRLSIDFVKRDDDLSVTCLALPDANTMIRSLETAIHKWIAAQIS